MDQDSPDGKILNSTIQNIFQNHNKAVEEQQKKGQRKGKSASKRDLELALTVLLVDLASCDQNFEPQEYNMIISGLMRVFGTSKTEVRNLVNQANQQLANLRGVSRFGNLLKENLDEEEKRAVMEVIEDLIMADGVEDGFETYLRHKIAGLLGVELKPASDEQAVENA